MSARQRPHADEALVAESLVRSVEALLMAADDVLTSRRLAELLADNETPDADADADAIDCALGALGARYADSALELVCVGGGWRFQIAADYSRLIGRLWQQKPPKLSRAMLETLALICYRQPITRAEIERVRGVAVSTQIVRALEHYEWIYVAGHRELPGRPAVFATTKRFLADFGLRCLDDLPALAEVRDPPALEHAIAGLTAAEGDAGTRAAAQSGARDD